MQLGRPPATPNAAVVPASWQTKVRRLAHAWLAPVLATGLALSLGACASDLPPPIASEGAVFGEDDHQSTQSMAIGDVFTVVLPGVPAGKGPLAQRPIRPRADGTVVSFKAMGVAAGTEDETPPSLAYVFEVVGEGRGRITIFDAAHRDRLILRVHVGVDENPARAKP